MPKFQTGQVVATPSALHMLQQAGVAPMTLLARHAFGDWGDLCKEDKEANDLAVAIGDRSFSSYEVGIGLSATLGSTALNANDYKLLRITGRMPDGLVLQLDSVSCAAQTPSQQVKKT